MVMSKRGLHIEADLQLSRFTTFQVGGPARHFVRATTRQTVIDSVEWAIERNLPLLVLGGGSNLLVADHGFPGLVLRIDLRGTEQDTERGAVLLTAAAGENWHELVTRIVAQNLAGVECLAGIPGQVGATPIQNVGAYGQEIKDTLYRVEALDLQTGKVCSFNNEECSFSYRKSRFKAEDRGRYIILGVTLRLIPGGEPKLFHDELERHLKAREFDPPQIADVAATVLDLRKRKSMILHEEDPNTRSVGSFFVNPVLDEKQFAMLLEAVKPYMKEGERIPNYPTLDGKTKVSAAWLIEHAGYARGYVHGNVGLSTRHALALINRGGATAHDVVSFAREIRKRVRDRFDITLLPEPTLVGLSLDEDEEPATAI
ncbi:MAG: UDP-N-acetylmuramate dehydrogenase [Armatimonadota bacterium]